MRVGVIADVHGNEQALDAVLTRLEAEGIDGIVCAGDLVGYGAAPVACVRRVLDRPGVRAVAGNHELMVLGRLGDEQCTATARRSLAWTRSVIDAQTRAAIAALPQTARIGGVLVAHGAVDDPQRYVRTEADARSELERVDPDVQVIVLGHTHEALAVSDRRGAVRARGRLAWAPGERLVLNPGAVGQARGGAPRARALLLDLDARSATFLELRYDLRACRRALREAGLPRDACHVPDRWGRLGRSWRDGAGALRIRSNQLRTQRQ